MAGNKFYLGQVIRRKAQNGNPIGPYLVVTAVGHLVLYASIIGSTKSISQMILKRNAYVHTQYSLVISEEMLRRLESGETICVSHKADIHWNRVYDNTPELIRFYTKMKGYEAIFTIENVRKVVSLGESIIRIIIANRVL